MTHGQELLKLTASPMTAKTTLTTACCTEEFCDVNLTLDKKINWEYKRRKITKIKSTAVDT